MRRRSSGHWFGPAALLASALLGTAVARAESGGHLGHHPGQPTPTAVAPAAVVPAQPGPVGIDLPPPPPMAGAVPSVQASAGCGGMMGCMGVGPRPFYAALLDMPALTPEARRFIEAEAERRIGSGSQAITAAQARLHHALAANDPTAVQQATAGARVGLLQLESGTAALRALAAGTPPRELALAWFKGQLGVATVESAPKTMDAGPWGLSWYHLTTMVFLVAFLVAALLIQYARMRRISGLVLRLTAGPPEAAPGPTAASGLTPSPGPSASPPARVPAAEVAPVPAAVALKQPWSGTLRVAAIFKETPTVKTFRLEDPEDGAIPFIFLPGQFLTFLAEIEGMAVRRSYTIASSPAQRDYVEITVKREEQGAESRYLHDQVAVGDLLQVSGPAGNFTFTGEEAASIVLIAGGVGITPMMCVIRYLTDRGFPGDIFLLYGARAIEEFIFREELEYLRKRHASLHVTATLDYIEGTTWKGATGPISKQFIARAVPDIARSRVHVCGPPAMMDAVKVQLLELGVAGAKIKMEAFGPAQGRVPAPAVPAFASVLPLDPAIAPGLPNATAQVEFTKAGKSAPLAPDQTVLEAGEAIGVEIDYSCRVGTCGICMVPLKAGTVTMEIEEGLPPEKKGQGFILACQAKSLGNLVVEA